MFFQAADVEAFLDALPAQDLPGTSKETAKERRKRDKKDAELKRLSEAFSFGSLLSAGVGAATAKRLNAKGITTVKQIRSCSKVRDK